jgi:glycosyltransferase involved in cell wall biosynthesis
MLGWWSKHLFTTFAGMPVHRCPESPNEATQELVKHITYLRPHFVIALGDVPWLSYLASGPIRDAIADSGSRLCLYFPVDGVLPNQRIPLEWIRILQSIDIPITMSRFGLAAVARTGIDAICIPHGCDIDVFKPPPCKETAKQILGYQDKFVILSDVRNHRRKLIPRLLDIAKMLPKQKNKFVLHLHTNVPPEEDQDAYSYDLLTDIERLGLKSVVRLTRDRISRGPLPLSKMAKLYAAADVHLLTSYGEGFGLPTLQAASAGVVPIGCLHSANTELIGKHGFAIPPEASTLDEFGIVRAFIDRRMTAAALLELSDNNGLLFDMSRSARRFALDYSWGIIVGQWDQLFQNHLMKPNAKMRATITSKVARSNGYDCSRNIRPSGHSTSILPPPRLGMPARPGKHHSNLLVVPRKLATRFAVLERLFPGLTIAPRENIETAKLARTVQNSLLIVDPDRSLHSRIDFVCASIGTSFLGASSYWPAVKGRSLYLQSRALLTDMPLAEKRLQVARERIEAV